MKTLFKAAALASVTLAGMTVAAPAVMAQSRTSIAVADYEGAVTKSAAFTTAMTQMQTTYAAQIKAVQDRAAQLQADAQPAVDAYNAAAKAPGATDASIRPAAEALQRKQTAAQQEIGRLNQPILLARAYVEDQIVVQLDAAVKAAMTAKKVDLLIQPQAVLAREPYVDITDAVVAELNRRVPSVGIVPPAGYEPGKLQKDAQQRQAPAAAQPQGR
ncbi:OmpH family outer membrane protein [Sphingorhabdus soli]|uniref:OmpH family outer membrane protein n=1 Tax=Flavisphingopyxis soli TaxID=2601267 RepID=A0A5C6U794_9SPHN|nr:OmpH family outer membrane protein [Sphingorhabdus soli]TXC68817.1 OmpH family outer membrane protein [Sphingorhabdus soli]